jgi:hypothetical protein
MQHNWAMRPLPFPVPIHDWPIIGFDVDLSELIGAYGEPHKDVIEPEMFTFPGPVKLWAFEFDCGLQLAIEYCVGASLTVLYSPQHDFEHLLRHIELPIRNLWIQDAVKNAPQNFVACRLDDNANEFEIATFATREGAQCTVSNFASRKHKQMYWVRERNGMK